MGRRHLLQNYSIITLVPYPTPLLPKSQTPPRCSTPPCLSCPPKKQPNQKKQDRLKKKQRGYIPYIIYQCNSFWYLDMFRDCFTPTNKFISEDLSPPLSLSVCVHVILCRCNGNIFSNYLSDHEKGHFMNLVLLPFLQLSLEMNDVVLRQAVGALRLLKWIRDRQPCNYGTLLWGDLPLLSSVRQLECFHSISMGFKSGLSEGQSFHQLIPFSSINFFFF